MCKILEISSELSYTSAYSAMLYAGRALMLLKGYRPIGVNKHKTVVEFIGAYVGENYKILIEKFDNMRKKRNLLTYEPWRLNVSKTDTENALKSAREFVSFIRDKVKEENPQIEFKF
ncbi:MAG: HEPN domain-containing protein [Candidatus Omnitrophica bacterium]|nr:HEPN domain-containing protein [Candidatus Omnitrophota bacterium]